MIIRLTAFVKSCMTNIKAWGLSSLKFISASCSTIKETPNLEMGALGRKFGVHIGVIHGVIHR